MVDVDTPKPRLHYVSEGYLHYSEGTAGDGNIYVDDDGYNVKLDKLGRRYRVIQSTLQQSYHYVIYYVTIWPYYYVTICSTCGSLLI